MSVVGEAFIAISPLLSGFAAKLEQQLASSGVTTKLEKQFENAGVLSGNAYSEKFIGALKLGGFGQAGVGAGLAIAAGVVVGLSQIGKEFGEVHHQIVVETGATAKEIERVFDTVKETALSVPASLHDIATAVDELFGRGVPLGEQLEKLAKQELFLAKITGTDLAANVQSTTALFAQFNVPIAQQSRELDVLFKASQHSGAGITSLIEALRAGGAPLQQFGFGLDKAAALITSLQAAGVNVEPALAGLRLAFGKIAQEGGNPQKVLAALLEEFERSPHSAKAAGDAIALFGTRSGVELTTALQSGRFNVDALFKAITNGKDGILATGAATLTLGDRFTLLRAKIEESLSGAAIAVRHGLGDALRQAQGPVVELVDSLVRLAAAIGPSLAPIAALFGAAFQGAIAVVSAFATDLDFLAKVFEHLGTVGSALAIGLGTLTIAFFAVGTSMGSLIGVLGALGVVFEVVTAPITIFVAAIVTAAAVIDHFTHEAKQSDGTKRFREDLFDTANAAGVFATGLKTAEGAFSEFLTKQVEAGQSEGARVIGLLLSESHTNVDELTRALSAGGAQWTKYKSIVAAAEVALGKNGLTVEQTNKVLDRQATRFNRAIQAGLELSVNAGQLTEAQLKNLEATNKNADGQTNWARVADGANVVIALQASRVALLAEQHTKAALTVAQHTKAYAELTRQIALGTISEQDAKDALVSMGVDLSLVDDKFKALSDSVSSFITTAVGKLPTVGDAISEFSADIKSDLDDIQGALSGRSQAFVDFQQHLGAGAARAAALLTPINERILADQEAIRNGTVTTTSQLDADLHKRSALLLEAAKNGGKGSKDLAQAIIANNRTVHNSYAQLISDNDPAKFTKLLVDQAVKILTFTANLKTLVAENFGSLAGELAKLGPDAAGQLASQLANAPAKAKIANAAATIGKQATDSFAQFLKLNFPELQGGEQAGNAVGKGIAKGITDELLKEFPALRLLGIGVGTEVGKGIGAGITAVDIRRFGADAGLALGQGTSGGLESALPRVKTDLRRFGLDGGLAYAEGLAKGIADNQKKATDAAAAVAEAVKRITEDHFEAQSPSRAAMRIGAFYVQGLAIGITTSTRLATDAAAALADQTISATSDVGTSIASGLASGVRSGLPSVTSAVDGFTRTLQTKLNAITFSTPDLQASLPSTLSISVTPDVAPIADLAASLNLTPIVAALPTLATTAAVEPIVAALPTLTTSARVTPVLSALPAFAADLALSPVVGALPAQTGVVHLDASVDPIADLAARVNVEPVVAPLPVLAATAQVTPVVGALPPVLLPATVVPTIGTLPNVTLDARLRPVVGPIAALTRDLNLVPVVGPVPAQHADLPLTPLVGALPALASSLALTPEVGPLGSFAAPVTLDPTLGPLPAVGDLPARIAATVAPVVIPPLTATAAVTPLVGPLPSLSGDLALQPVVGPIGTLSATLGLTPVIPPLPPLAAHVVPHVDALPAIALTAQVTPVVPTIEPLAVQAKVAFSGLDQALAHFQTTFTDSASTFGDQASAQIDNLRARFTKGLDITKPVVQPATVPIFAPTPPPATFAKMLADLVLSGQTGATRQDALEQQRAAQPAVSPAQPLIGNVTVRKDSDIAFLGAELGWRLRGGGQLPGNH